jgi:L-threonylcarbamoyladenylate synthase
VTEIIKVDPESPDVEKIRKAARVINKGGLVVFPTETVYGLGANAFDEKATLKIFDVKGRPSDNPLIVHISSLEMLEEVSKDVPKIAFRLVKNLWPGPLTIIVKKSKKVPDTVTAGLETVAVRMPSHPVAKTLIELSGVPIAAPSANLSGKPSPTKFEHVFEDMFGKADVIIDGGETPFGLESTIIDLTKDPPVLLRPGPLTVEQIERICEIQVHEAATGKSHLERPLSPGMKYRHYAPEKPLILVENLKKMEEVLKMYPNGILICPKEHAEFYRERKIKILGSLENEYSIAHELFSVLREADKEDADVIIVEGLPEHGVLFAVMNRLRKAASEVIK